ncbi:L,D-transpeptidase [Geobacter sp. DSM 9736]|uniref:L,D-transpeptidase family protein n=1 Tax=Geobacter sp. DSM 9736 TaxID=1277350 RepID=UPI000B5105DD|nr:L,D-transpeptidase family protein [Geobacter sp. DSM 9736]SNB47121.1 L,D-peptidoglycan transpeptidase YkuD, ErfK/YbiS/YcfS/YnhG family [Geobacter sp. DSM 9736]
MRGHFFLFVALVVISGCAHNVREAASSSCLGGLSQETRQAVVVTPKAAPSAKDVTVRLFEKTEKGWKQAGASMDGVAGRNGLAPPGEKLEGDGRTPSGVFPLERGFGYEFLETKLPYIVLTPDMIWIDDPKSPLYNTLVSRSEGEGVSHEIMRRSDHLYRYGAVVEYNTKTIVPGAGSAIFFHIWRDPDTATAGCVATAEADMVRMLQWLDPAKRPEAVIRIAGCEALP